MVSHVPHAGTAANSRSLQLATIGMLVRACARDFSNDDGPTAYLGVVGLASAE